MNVNEKIYEFVQERRITFTELAEDYGTNYQTVSNYLQGKRGMPLSFIVFMKEKYPEIDLNLLFSEEDVPFVVPPETSGFKQIVKREKILEEIDAILAKFNV